MYIITGNENFQEGKVIAVALTKQSAEEFVKSLGFFRGGDNSMWVNSMGDDGGWLRIKPVGIIGKDNDEIARYIEHLTGR